MLLGSMNNIIHAFQVFSVDKHQYIQYIPQFFNCCLSTGLDFPTQRVYYAVYNAARIYHYSSTNIVHYLCISIEISWVFGVSLISPPDKSMQLLCFSYGDGADENGPFV